MPTGKKRAAASQASNAATNPRSSRRGLGTESTLESILSASQFKLTSERLHVVGQALKKFCASKYKEGQRIGSDQFFSFAGEQGGLSIPSATSLFSLEGWARQLGLVLRYDNYSPEEQKEKCGGDGSTAANKLDYQIKTFTATLCTRVLLDPSVLADMHSCPGVEGITVPSIVFLCDARMLYLIIHGWGVRRQLCLGQSLDDDDDDGHDDDDGPQPLALQPLYAGILFSHMGFGFLLQELLIACPAAVLVGESFLSDAEAPGDKSDFMQLDKLSHSPGDPRRVNAGSRSARRIHM